MLKAPESTYTKSDKGGAGTPEKEMMKKADSTLTQKDNGVDKSRAGGVSEYEFYTLL